MTIKTPDHLVISQELLHVLQWLLEERPDLLKNLVNKAITTGVNTGIDHTENQSISELQQYVIDFFMTLELLVQDACLEQEVTNAISHNTIPEMCHIDTQYIDDESIVSKSIEQTTKILKKEDPSENSAKDTLYKELLKNWKPNKHLEIN